MRTTVNIPDEMYEKLKRVAERERRSIAKQIVWWIEHQVNREEKEAS